MFHVKQRQLFRRPAILGQASDRVAGLLLVGMSRQTCYSREEIIAFGHSQGRPARSLQLGQDCNSDNGWTH